MKNYNFKIIDEKISFKNYAELKVYGLPEVCFTYFPMGLTLEGQYIVKNLIIISAALTITGSIRRAQLNKKITA